MKKKEEAKSTCDSCRMKKMTHAPHTKIQLLLIMVISLDHNCEELQPLPYFP